MAESTKHYTAVLEIIETDEYMAADQFSRGTQAYREAAGLDKQRRKTEVARVVVRGSTMSELTRRLRKHVEIVEEEYAEPVRRVVETKDFRA